MIDWYSNALGSIVTIIVHLISDAKISHNDDCVTVVGSMKECLLHVHTYMGMGHIYMGCVRHVRSQVGVGLRCSHVSRHSLVMGVVHVVGWDDVVVKEMRRKRGRREGIVGTLLGRMVPSRQRCTALMVS